MKSIGDTTTTVESELIKFSDPDESWKSIVGNEAMPSGGCLSIVERPNVVSVCGFDCGVGLCLRWLAMYLQYRPMALLFRPWKYDAGDEQYRKPSSGLTSNIRSRCAVYHKAGFGISSQLVLALEWKCHNANRTAFPYCTVEVKAEWKLIRQAENSRVGGEPCSSHFLNQSINKQTSKSCFLILSAVSSLLRDVS